MYGIASRAQARHRPAAIAQVVIGPIATGFSRRKRTLAKTRCRWVITACVLDLADRSAGAGIIGSNQSQPRFTQHLLTCRLTVVTQINAGRMGCAIAKAYHQACLGCARLSGMRYRAGWNQPAGKRQSD